jgi:hypothetical protein
MLLAFALDKALELKHRYRFQQTRLTPSAKFSGGKFHATNSLTLANPVAIADRDVWPADRTLLAVVDCHHMTFGFQPNAESALANDHTGARRPLLHDRAAP